jgi:hypothetical protein
MEDEPVGARRFARRGLCYLSLVPTQLRRVPTQETCHSGINWRGFAQGISAISVAETLAYHHSNQKIYWTAPYVALKSDTEPWLLFCKHGIVIRFDDMSITLHQATREEILLPGGSHLS